MRILTSILLAASISGCLQTVSEMPDAATSFDAGTDAGPADAGHPFLRVATFNVHRLFDTECQSGMCNAGDYEEVFSVTDFNAKVDLLAAGIRQLDADIVMLEEIENQTCMDALSAKLNDAYRGSSFAETGGAASVDVGVLSREPIGVTNRYRMTPILRPDGSQTAFTREFYEVHTTYRGRDVIGFATHFRSKVNDDPGRRLAEAQAAHDIVIRVATANPQAIVVLAGDLNDTPGSDPLNALEAGNQLYRLASDLPASEQYTYYFNGQGSAIDHIFHAVVSAGIPIAKSAHVSRGMTGYAGSDHAAITADLSLNP